MVKNLPLLLIKLEKLDIEDFLPQRTQSAQREEGN